MTTGNKNDLFKTLRTKLSSDRYSEEDIKLAKKAFDLANKAHNGQIRKTGEPYIIHPLATAIKLADLKLPIEIIVAGLLHDVPEDTNITIEEIQKEFGDDIAGMVNGVTKLGHVQYRGIKRYVENLRKMFLAMAQDVRVIFIKFADRMHNMETLYVIPEHKRLRIAKEVMEIYAPIANRLGMGEYRGLFEDYAFRYLEPREYNWTKHLLEQRVKKAGPAMDRAIKNVSEEMQKNGIKPVNIHGRIKFCYSLYKKLKRYDKDINKIYDIVALRIIVNDVSDCYATLGILHGMYTPLSGRIKDYIAQPKPNGYQSLHTTVFDDQGSILEFQIRTLEMHEEAEYGIAAHWRYKEQADPQDKKVDWMNELVKIQKELGEADFMNRLDELKLDMFHDRIFVFSPNGDVFDLPEGSTPIDFAYAIHTDIGDKASIAKINHQIVNLNTPLRSGDMCEIIIDKKRKGPNPDWLKFVKTHHARTKIKDAIRRNKRSFLPSFMNRNK
ncbi:bifunctional (p)ppGpp synthetase/guanosine-3',5'-bis(diphosphate) 3'-pyrophosphohydrolase [Candidatus Parcubacteria bacterium]|nr:MAG: bifunctional (p)ppGpp synthetase/guanosine-3',5'-bis(diphosphate) 3'-pyrophosphohydrolase [Candidatus Parcubacteria bacterium]